MDQLALAISAAALALAVASGVLNWLTFRRRVMVAQPRMQFDLNMDGKTLADAIVKRVTDISKK